MSMHHLALTALVTWHLSLCDGEGVRHPKACLLIIPFSKSKGPILTLIPLYCILAHIHAFPLASKAMKGSGRKQACLTINSKELRFCPVVHVRHLGTPTPVFMLMTKHEVALQSEGEDECPKLSRG